MGLGRRTARVWMTAILVAGIAACGDEDPQDAAAEAESAGVTNRAPVISGKPDPVAIEDQPYDFTPTALDPDGDTLDFSVNGKPGWMTFDAGTGRLSGTPKNGDIGKYRGIVITVSDGQVESQLASADIEVLPASAADNTGPVISGTPAGSALVGDFYDFIPVASDADGDALSFEIENQPYWADFEPQIGRLYGTPDDAAIGTYGNIVIRVSDGIATSALDPFVIVVNPQPVTNFAPTISGDPPTSVLVGETYSFSPVASDADGDPLTFSGINQPDWATLDAATGTLSGVPGLADAGTYSGVSIVVSDGEASAALTSFQIEVVGPNTPPTIAGTPTDIAMVGEVYSFVPAASDADGDPLWFSISNPPSWISFNGLSGALTGVPSAGDAGLYANISITVTDGEDQATLGPFSIEVAEPNHAPTIDGAPDASITVGELYDFMPAASDADGDALSFSIENQPFWAVFDPSTGRLTGTPGDAAVGTYGNIVIRVGDGTVTTALDPFVIVVNPEPVPNAAPTISGSPATSVLAGETYTFTPTASDADGDPLTFSVVNQPGWAQFDPVTGTLSGVPGTEDDGVYSGISIVVSDGEASTALASFQIEVFGTNAPPVIGGTPAATVTAGEVYSFVPIASDADGDRLSFSISGQPSWIRFKKPTGALNGVPADGDIGVYDNISITVTDGEDEAMLGPFSIEVVEPNYAPTISGTPADSVTVGDFYDFIPVASDANGDALSFSIANQPAWADFDSAIGRLSGTPADTDVGTYGNIVISVDDGTDSSALAPFVIVVNPEPATNTAPTISGSPATSVLAGDTYSFTPTASDADDDPLTFSVVNQPGWAAFDTSTGTLSGVPDAADDGVYPGVSIVVSDGEASAALASFQIEVIAPNTPPTIGGTPPASVTVGDVLSFLPDASDADGDALTFSIVGLPSWASFNVATGALNGAPDDGDVGDYTGISITVTDGEDDATLGPFSIEVVAANVAPTIGGSPAGSVTVGDVYDFVPVASDANGDALSFSIQNRPAWAAFDSGSGRLSGTPADTDAGTYGNIVISVSDGVETTSLAPFVIVVNPEPVPNSAPTISGSPATSVLSGQMYSFTPTASDVDGDLLTFSIVNQPGWTVFDTSTGTLSGMPDAADDGIYSGISIVVSDGEASTALKSFQIEVIGPNTPPTISGTPPSSVLVGEVYSFVPTASDADGDTLSFSINGLPSWAGFNAASGALTGVPTPDAGGVYYNNISITVTDGEAVATLAPFSIHVIAPNQAPTIGGTPSTARVGQAYSFRPTANDPDGDTLTFSISGRPSWAAFNTATGALTGMPSAGDVGVYNNISITVSDGEASATLGPFSIEVASIGTGSATLSWMPPTQNTDDSPLMDLSGFVVYWGTVAGNYSDSATLANPGLTSYVVENLMSGTTYYFALTAYNSSGVESSYSNEASKTIP